MRRLAIEQRMQAHPGIGSLTDRSICPLTQYWQLTWQAFPTRHSANAQLDRRRWSRSAQNALAVGVNGTALTLFLDQSLLRSNKPC
jgi:hypothetical protein